MKSKRIIFVAFLFVKVFLGSAVMTFCRMLKANLFMLATSLTFIRKQVSLRSNTMIFDIQRFSTHDGAGIRTTVFFKGCPLRCPWCENPESQSAARELAYDARLCIGCHDCARRSPDGEIRPAAQGIIIDRKKVSDPSRFEGVCPSGALSIIGRDMTMSEILGEIRKDMPFYRSSGGGVTISGGEPYAQPVFLARLLKELAELGVRAAVETCLQAPWASIEMSLALVEELLADLKHVDSSKLVEVTGADFSSVSENFRCLAKTEARVTARVPVIPGFNDSVEEMTAIVDFAASLGNIREIHFLPYHTLGAGKYRLLGREYTFSAPAAREEDLEPYRALAQARGMTAITGG